jgi:hypothetical protein
MPEQKYIVIVNYHAEENFFIITTTTKYSNDSDFSERWFQCEPCTETNCY